MMSSKRWLALILATYFMLACWYNLTTPILETPDEVWHFEYARQVALNHALPVMDAQGQALYRHEGLQPPLYYLLGAPFIAWLNPQSADALPASNPFAQIGIPRADTNDNRNAFLHAFDTSSGDGAALAVHLLRLYSTLLGACTIILTYCIARELFPTTAGLWLLAAAFVAFLPQFLFISGAISNDNLATALSVAVLWQSAVTMRVGLSPLRAAGLGALVGAALLTKLNTIALAAVVLFAFAYIVMIKKQTRAIIIGGAVFSAMVVFIAGWWYWRNVQLYGDPTAFSLIAQLVGERPAPPGFWQWLIAENEGLRLSTWGVFGWFNILAPRAFYLFYDLLAIVGLSGIAVALARRPRPDARVILLPLWILLIVIALWTYSARIASSQGRLLFPALPAWAILWAWGLVTLIPSRARELALLVVGLALVAVAALVPLFVLAPAYTPRALAASQLPPDTARLDWRFANGVEWLGARVARRQVRPGESFDVTIYTRAPVGTVPRDVLFIHLVNSADVIVAQRDSFIGSGNQRTLSDDAIIEDTFRVSIPATAPAPDTWRVEVGMYDPQTGARVQVSDPAGNPLGEAVTLAALDGQAPAPDAFHFEFEGGAALAGASFERKAIARGDTLRLTLSWGALPRSEEYHVFVHALGKNDHIWAAADVPLGGARTTTIELPFDPQTPPDVYPLELGVYPAPGGDRVGVHDAQGQNIGDHIFLGPIRVTNK